ncbi:conserved hypothetical protein [Segniliparus rotundus DSM 44985]|uniref:Putative Flp pilus-assembly TadG-like N-terminal domain-containing protein n=1 Tax=Segniliparus rotundus (strain ATCC BAA-972 / CDC 1076 / CIP 108378 / DSM 44985 / JCM 13578) TaxID=640132 RepID=D6ZC70_SEGRD|nr:Rv3654c family TadE-like protein [Segniliparus rotundus]ADG99039.1 conserved hypothetical protein [Segniliparus rotundus DSM 44985]
MKDEQGATTLLSACAIAALMMFVLLLSWLCAAVSARHRAQSEADLAALAGAYRALDGEEAACAAARALAAQSSGRLASCRLADLDVLVVVEVDVAAAGFSFGPARAGARAGPAPG